MSSWRSGLLSTHRGRSFPTRRRDLTSAGIIAIGAVLAVFVVLGTILLHRGGTSADNSHWNTPGQALPPWEPPPAVPVPVRPAPSAESPSPSPSLTLSPGTVAPISRQPQAGASRPRPEPTQPTRPAPVIPPAGSRISLVADGRSDLRLRHRDFRVGLEMVGPGSSRSDRSDSTFVVRSGLGDGRCLSLESVNFPGRFVRHQNFRLYLHQRERTPLFAADATFCAQPVGSAGAFVLRAVNYPDRYLTTRRSAIELSRVPAGRAQVFRAADGL